MIKSPKSIWRGVADAASRLPADRNGGAALEYVLIAASVALAVFGVLTLMGAKIVSLPTGASAGLR
jgi:Flp pilus assembly pilin Flp